MPVNVGHKHFGEPEHIRLGHPKVLDPPIVIVLIDHKSGKPHCRSRFHPETQIIKKKKTAYSGDGNSARMLLLQG
jgi:hypothetical protein